MPEDTRENLLYCALDPFQVSAGAYFSVFLDVARRSGCTWVARPCSPCAELEP